MLLFGRSNTLIPTGEGRLFPPITTGTPNVFHLPASLTLQPHLQPHLQPSLQASLHPSLQPILQPSLQPTLDPILHPILDPILDPKVGPILDPILDPKVGPKVGPIVGNIVGPKVSSCQHHSWMVGVWSKRIPKGKGAVSYTHLTLPTILRV